MAALPYFFFLPPLLPLFLEPPELFFGALLFFGLGLAAGFLLTEPLFLLEVLRVGFLFTALPLLLELLLDGRL